MEQNSQGLFELEIDHQASIHFIEIAKWSKFMSVVWFVLCGLMAIGSVVMGIVIASAAYTKDNPFAGLGGFFVTIGYLIMAAVPLIPNIFRYKFAVKMLLAVRNSDQELLNESLKSLKFYNRFWGILTIIVVSFYILTFIFILFAFLIGLSFN